MDDLGDLAELRLLAVLATYRRDGTVQPRREGRASAARSESKHRGVRTLPAMPRSRAPLQRPTPHRRSRRCGEADRVSLPWPRAGVAYAERAGDDLLICLEPGDLRAWDFAGELT